MSQTTAIRLGWLLALLLLLVVAAAASVAFGVREVGIDAVIAALQGKQETTDQAAALLRIPRTLLAAAVGAALAVAGVTMQAVTRNPLADPGIFGVLAGASLFVVTGIAFFQITEKAPQMLMAILGSGLAAIFVYAVGSLGRDGATPLKLALAGAATTAALSSLVSVVLLPRQNVMEEFRFWQIGSVGGASFTDLLLGLPPLTIGAVICLLSATSMNSLALGDDVATALGTNVIRARLIAVIGSVILCGVATALAGPIGFVGLIVSHFCRLLVGIDHRWLIPYSALVGAIVLIVADTLGRVVAKPSEIAVGILLPLIGAPLFIWFVRRQKVREL